jgi:hypothetical protein
MMKSFGIALVALPLFAPSAFSSSDIKAAMEVVYASGFYNSMRSGTLALNFLDGESAPSSMTLSVEGRKLKANLTGVRYGNCGDKYTARLNIPNERTATDFELLDYSQVRCRLYVKDKWHATISTRESDGSVSRVQMTGTPAP